MTSLSEHIRSWLYRPLHDHLDRLECAFMAAIDDLNAAIARQFDALAPAIDDVRTKIAGLYDLIADDATEEQLRAAVAAVDASTNRIAGAVRDSMADPATPDPDVEIPPEVNPGTPDPEAPEGGGQFPG